MSRPDPSTPPPTPDALHEWIRLHLDIIVPRTPLLESSSAPFDYITHTFFEGEQHHSSAAPPNTPLLSPPDARCLVPDASSPDCIVWANRGGGKTFYAALATTLDLIFKPGISITVLGGSLDQSQRMHEHLRRFFERPALAALLDAPITQRRAALINASSAEVLAQSQTSVRGTRPQKIRCDEVELFDPEVWRAAQLVVRSRVCGTFSVRGGVEALSTMHQPHGLMARITEHAGAGDHRARRLFRWGVIDVLEHCPPVRDCSHCALLEECASRARQDERDPGHFAIDDALSAKSRADRAAWEAEMLCLRPSRSDTVYPEFERVIHVADFDAEPFRNGARWIVGMDFGIRSPAVILWGCVDNSGVLRIVDERIRSGAVLAVHAEAIRTGAGSAPRPWPQPAWVGVDPAGFQRSDQTGLSNITALRRAGLVIRAPHAPLHDGLRAVRARLAPASGAPTLFIHPRCTNLIKALEAYRWRPAPHLRPEPLKDSHDHPADALRYLIVPLDAHTTARMQQYG